MNKGDLVTIPLEENNTASNTYIVHAVLEDECILSHPLNPDVLIAKPKAILNSVAANMKDSTERSLNFAQKKSKYLDHNTIVDIESLTLYFIVNRKLSARQKSTLSNICGNLASIHFNGDLRSAMEYVTQNSALLDDFNSMWYNNFKGLFTGKQPVTSPKQRASIFNIAGFVLAELESQTAPK